MSIFTMVFVIQLRYLRCICMQKPLREAIASNPEWFFFFISSPLSSSAKNKTITLDRNPIDCRDMIKRKLFRCEIQALINSLSTWSSDTERFLAFKQEPLFQYVRKLVLARGKRELFKFCLTVYPKSLVCLLGYITVKGEDCLISLPLTFSIRLVR